MRLTLPVIYMKGIFTQASTSHKAAVAYQALHCHISTISSRGSRDRSSYIHPPTFTSIYLSIYLPTYPTYPEEGSYTHSSVHLLLLIVFYFWKMGAGIRTTLTKLTDPTGNGGFFMPSTLEGWSFDSNPAFFCCFYISGERNSRVPLEPNQLGFLILTERVRLNFSRLNFFLGHVLRMWRVILTSERIYADGHTAPYIPRGE